MNTKKLLAVITASLILLSSCSDTPQEDDKETQSGASDTLTDTETEKETESTDPDAVDSLPEGLTFDGMEFNMLSSDRGYNSLTTEGLTGDVLNDEKYYLEATTEDRFDIEITETVHDLWELRDFYVNNLVVADDTTFTAVNQWDSHAVTSASRGHCIPYEEIEYIDLTKKYWGDVLSESLAIGGHNYFAIGSYNLSIYEKIGSLFMNKEMAAAHQLEIPFEDVYNGTWTLEKFLSYEGIATNDLNGDGFMTAEDSYTYGTSDRRPIGHQIWIASGLKVIEKDENDMPYITIFNNEKFYDILTITKDTFFDGTNILSYELSANGATSEVWNKGNQLFHFAHFKANIGMRDIDIDYAILPVPKYDENQEDYYAHTYQGCATYVLSNVRDTSFAGAVIESMCAYGYNKVVPAYIDSTLQDKIARDPQSKEMIQFIFDRRTIDLGETLLFDQFGDSEIYSLLQKNSNVISSWLQKMSKPSDMALERVMEKLS